MHAYAIAHLRNITMGQPIATYLERIDATLAPFHGRFLVHGGAMTPLEGDFNSAVVIIEFPDADTAHAWYRSAAYQDILPLRTDNAEGDAFIVQGVAADYKAVSKLHEVRMP
jgi:uncharacterized protein (DUF1330 family)